jgi:phosphoenolpyruvate carboxykinase (ATP)
MLSNKMKESGANVWLVNTGWSGGPYGVGKRMSLKITRALITAALEGKLNDVDYHTHEIFGLNMPVSCPNVPTEVLNPKNTWADKKDYDNKANLLANEFIKNFKKFEDDASDEVIAGAPTPH